MLVLKNLDIDLTKSETKTLLGFLFLYSFLILVIISVVSFIYYNFQKELMLQEKREVLQEYSNTLKLRLKDLHINFDKYRFYPRDERFNSAIFDSNKKLIFSTIKKMNVYFDEVSYVNKKKIYFIEKPESYYLGAKYIVIEVEDAETWYKETIKTIFIFSIIAFIFMSLIGYFIAKLFLKPMRDSIHLLDRFIKDTTHELNTPVSTVLNNVEMLQNITFDEKTKRKINRIEIAAKTISNIYEDLTFLTLDNKIISEDKDLNLSEILEQRVEYFKSLASLRKIDFILNIKKDVFIFSDEKKLSKLIDNLLSNAIKYNKIKGFITVNLNNKYLSIEDSGIGMKNEQLNSIFDRYTRFNKSAGGFGIGLNIVSLIAKEYNFKIDYSSELNIGTKVEVKW